MQYGSQFLSYWKYLQVMLTNHILVKKLLAPSYIYFSISCTGVWQTLFFDALEGTVRCSHDPSTETGRGAALIG